MKKRNSIILAVLILIIGLLFLFHENWNVKDRQLSTSITNKQINKHAKIEEKNKVIISANDKVNDHSDINIFWDNFRRAILEKDIEELKNLTSFPLGTRGPWDSNPIVRFEESKFENVINIFLEQDYNLEPSFEYIKRMEILSFNERGPYKEGDWVRIGDMEFNLIDNSWKLTFIYLDFDSYEKLGIDI